MFVDMDDFEIVRNFFENLNVTAFNQPIRNINGQKDTRRFDTSFGKAYNKSKDKTNELLREILKETKGNSKDAIIGNEQLQGAAKDAFRSNWLSNLTSTFAQLAIDAKRYYVELREYEFDLYENLINNADKLITKKINIAADYYKGSLDVVTDTLNGNIMEIGRQAAKYQITLAKNMWQYQREYGITVKESQNYASVKEQEFILGPQTDFALNVARALGVGIGNTVNEYSQYKSIKDGSYVSEEVSQVFDTEQFVNWIEGLRALKTEGNALIELRKRALDLDVDIQKKLFEHQQNLLNKAEEIYDSVSNMADTASKDLLNIDKTSKELSKQFGFVGDQAQAWTRTMIDNNVIAAKWAMKAEDFLHAQESYLETSGRAVNLNQAGGEDFNAMAALSRATGVDMKEIGSIIGDMNIFNTSVEHGVDSIGTMFRLANKMGVSGRKFMKDLSQNLKLAQKYNFQGGTEGMKKMSVWSQQVRLNMQSVTNFAEGIMDGGLESTLEKAAKLQVLGGNAAIYSDPLGMMYDAGADVANLARRIEGMLGNYGTLNSKTGETDFTWTDDMMVRQIAKGLGMDLEEAKNVLREKNKFSVARKQLNKGIFNEDEQREISNRATYNEKTGKFEVTLIGQGKKAIQNLTKADLDKIRSTSDDEALTQYAEESLNVEQNILSEIQYIAARIAADNGDSWYFAKKIQEEIIKANANNTIEVGNEYLPRTWNYENVGYAQRYNDMYTNHKNGVYNNAIRIIEAFTEAGRTNIGAFSDDAAPLLKFLEDNNADEYFKQVTGLANTTGSKNNIRVANKAQVNYARSKEGKSRWDSGWTGYMSGDLGNGVSEEDLRKYGGGAKSYIEPTKFTSAYGYNDHRSWVVQESNTTAVNSLTAAINNLSSVQIKSNADVKLNGTINLNGTNMKISADDLAKDPEFMQQLVSHISRRIDLNNNGGKSSGTLPGVVRK